MQNQIFEHSLRSELTTAAEISLPSKSLSEVVQASITTTSQTARIEKEGLLTTYVIDTIEANSVVKIGPIASRILDQNTVSLDVLERLHNTIQAVAASAALTNYSSVVLRLVFGEAPKAVFLSVEGISSLAITAALLAVVIALSLPQPQNPTNLPEPPVNMPSLPIMPITPAVVPTASPVVSDNMLSIVGRAVLVQPLLFFILLSVFFYVFKIIKL